MTKYAEKIFAIIEDSKDHLTADEIFHLLKKSDPKVVLATVYNNLNALCEQGRIRRIGIEGRSDRYDRIQRHDHLICSNCGALSDKDFSDLTDFLQRQMDEEILSYDLRVRYLCPECKGLTRE